MPARDRYKDRAIRAEGPANNLFVVVPNDAADLPYVTTAIYVGGGGDLAVKDRETDQTIVFRNLADGAALPIRVARIMATGTTCTNLVGMA